MTREQRLDAAVRKTAYECQRGILHRWLEWGAPSPFSLRLIVRRFADPMPLSQS